MQAWKKTFLDIFTFLAVGGAVWLAWEYRTPYPDNPDPAIARLEQSTQQMVDGCEQPMELKERVACYQLVAGDLLQGQMLMTGLEHALTERSAQLRREQRLAEADEVASRKEPLERTMKMLDRAMDQVEERLKKLDPNNTL